MNILLLEDEFQIGQDLQYILNREGYQADHFTTGEDAVSAAASKDYDLMILDIMLKRTTQTMITNGLEVARKIQNVKDIPYVLLTARSDSYDIMTGLDMGAEDYITKPYDLTVLLSKLRAVFRRLHRSKNDSMPNTLVVRNIILKAISHKVYADGLEVKLTPHQFDLLYYMMLHKNEVLSREELYRNVWGFNQTEGLSTNTLEVNIKRLRKIIGSDAVTTVRRKGYVMEE